MTNDPSVLQMVLPAQRLLSAIMFQLIKAPQGLVFLLSVQKPLSQDICVGSSLPSLKSMLKCQLPNEFLLDQPFKNSSPLSPNWLPNLFSLKILSNPYYTTWFIYLHFHCLYPRPPLERRTRIFICFSLCYRLAHGRHIVMVDEWIKDAWIMHYVHFNH